MLNSIKSKLTFIYISLIILILFVGISSIYHIQMINQSIDKLMVDNYKSISLVSKMIESIESQNINITTYLLGENKEGSIKEYNLHVEIFLENYYLEKSNITEEEELYYTEELLKAFNTFTEQFKELQKIYNNDGLVKAEEYYMKEINTTYIDIKSNLYSIIEINQMALLDKKGDTVKEAIKSKRIVFGTTIISILIGYSISGILEKKMLYSIALLTQRIKSIRAGNIGEQIPQKSNDELGEVIYEFNRMSKRLEEFEKSTLGKVMQEKNKSISIIKSIQDPIIVLNDNFRIIMVNDTCEEFFNIKEKVVINREFDEVIKYEKLCKLINIIQDNKNIKQSERVIELSKDNKYYYFNISITFIRTENEGTEGFIIVLKDITELKKLEKTKDNFLATITHEIKTPITSIMIGTSLMENNKIGDLNKEQSNILKDIKSDGERLNNLVNNLLNISKLQLNNTLLNYSHCNVEELIKTSITTLSQLAKEKLIIVDYEVEKEVDKIEADFEKLTWVINNLISNAIKNCSEWDVITLRAFTKGDKLLITVTDTGKGIPEDMLDKIFKEYVQVDYNIDSVKGVGLGLAISKAIVIAHNGEIWCESQEGLGSTFTFSLPLS